jgi:hypothetical protein
MEIIRVSRPHASYVAYVTPGVKVEIHTHNPAGYLVNVKVFKVGDIAEYDSYNLSYTAPITKITPKRITFETGNKVQPRTKHLNYESFAWRNHDFDVHETAVKNSEVMQYI